MAAGKNAASDILCSDYGFVATDCDLLVHSAIENAREKIFDSFGEIAAEKGINIKNSDGSVNRRELGRLIFPSPALVKKQESIVFPETQKLIEKFIAENSGKDIVINATVLYKIEAIKLCDAVIFVDAPYILRLLRARKRDNLSLSQIRQRFRAQKTLFLEYKRTGADIHKVWNFGTRKKLSEKLGIVLKNAVFRG